MTLVDLMDGSLNGQKGTLVKFNASKGRPGPSPPPQAD